MHEKNRQRIIVDVGKMNERCRVCVFACAFTELRSFKCISDSLRLRSFVLIRCLRFIFSSLPCLVSSFSSFYLFTFKSVSVVSVFLFPSIFFIFFRYPFFVTQVKALTRFVFTTKEKEEENQFKLKENEKNWATFRWRYQRRARNLNVKEKSFSFLFEMWRTSHSGAKFAHRRRRRFNVLFSFYS